ncbi:bifunctional homocysteine S-methyltransferase/methylenetetrahydrofolate reductase [Candidatus Sumerlaeota bacterium]|nr:bifunctional homocysteine S-methyltransferase/methylenetetrahydrofolate reductase [Candidatus Sumerlaeota bacterium]
MANQTKQDFRQQVKSKIIVADGAMGTMLYSRGIYINQCFEFLNILRPHMVKQIHREYLMAGAELLETNTFGANEVKLAGFGLQDRVFDINFQGARLAKEVAGASAYVAGSIGPLGKPLAPVGIISTEDAIGYFKRQVEALIEGGVDIFILETFSDILEIKIAIKAVRSLTDKPIIAQMTLMEDKKTIYGITPEVIAKQLSEEAIDVMGLNCSVGPAIMLECIELMRPHTSLPLSAQPNAGLPRNVDGRLIYLTTPEYMAEYARRFIQSGVSIVGACCGSTPEHTKAIKNLVKSIQPVQAFDKSVSSIEVESSAEIRAPEVKPSQVEESALARKLKEGKFVVSVEIDPPLGADPSKALASATTLREHNVDAINIADSPRASARMSPLALALLINNQIGIEIILHYCCRDRNILGMQSDLLGAHALGIRNLLLITGDPPKLGNYPFATAVFDVDSIGLVRIATNLNEGKDLIGNPLGKSTNFFIGVGANPGAIDLDTEIRRFEDKVKNGAQFCLTQPVFDIRLFENFLKRIEEFKIPILAGILPLYSYRNAEFLHNEVPGMQIPEPIRERMRRTDSPEAARSEGVRIAQESLKEIKPMVQGAYFMPPFGKVELALQVLEILN